MKAVSLELSDNNFNRVGHNVLSFFNPVGHSVLSL